MVFKNRPVYWQYGILYIGNGMSESFAELFEESLQTIDMVPGYHRKLA